MNVTFLGVVLPMSDHTQLTSQTVIQDNALWDTHEHAQLSESAKIIAATPHNELSKVSDLHMHKD